MSVSAPLDDLKTLADSRDEAIRRRFGHPYPVENRQAEAGMPTRRGPAVAHYNQNKIQPIEFILANDIPHCEACAIKYLVRWRSKGGVADLKKARDYIDFLINQQEKGSPL